jgi:hypothetical protein
MLAAYLDLRPAKQLGGGMQALCRGRVNNELCADRPGFYLQGLGKVSECRVPARPGAAGRGAPRRRPGRAGTAKGADSGRGDASPTTTSAGT